MKTENVTWAKERMAMMGLSQRQFAKKIGINQSIISHMFCGRRQLPTKEASAWAQLLNVPVETILEKFSQSNHDYRPSDSHSYGLVSRKLVVDQHEFAEAVQFILNGFKEGWIENPYKEIVELTQKWGVR